MWVSLILSPFTFFFAVVLGSVTEYRNSEVAAFRQNNDINYHYPQYYPHAMSFATTPIQAIPRPSSRHMSVETEVKEDPLPVSLQNILQCIPMTCEAVTTFLKRNTHLIPFFLQLAFTQLDYSHTKAYLMLLVALMGTVSVFVRGDYLGCGFFGRLSLIIYSFILLNVLGIIPLWSLRTICTRLALAGYASSHPEYSYNYILSTFAVSFYSRDQHLLFAIQVLVATILHFIFSEYGHVFLKFVPLCGKRAVAS